MEQYTDLEMEIIIFDSEDVITASDVQLPPGP